MKLIFAFLLLLATAFLLLTVISGIGNVFGRIADTWSAQNTDGIADALTKILYFGGIVFVAVLGFSLFTATTQSVKWGTRQRNQASNYEVLPDDQSLPVAQPTALLQAPQDAWDQWNTVEQPKQHKYA